MVLIIINMILGFAIAYMQFRFWFVVRKKPWAYVRLATGLLGLIWGIIYINIFYIEVINPTGAEEYRTFVQSFVRPTILLTLAMMLANVIITRRGNNKK